MLEGIEVVRTWTAIRSLSLENTGSYDGSPVGEFQRYEFLGIKNNSDAWKYLQGMHIDDLSPLFQMPNLETVEMSASEQYRMEELIAEYGEPQFQINYL